jgi:hypothetical protein
MIGVDQIPIRRSLRGLVNRSEAVFGRSPNRKGKTAYYTEAFFAPSMSRQYDLYILQEKFSSALVRLAK